MATDNPVLAARSALGHAARSGDDAAIAKARNDLAIAKADRLRKDAEALLAGLDKTTVRVIGYADTPGPTREQHGLLLQHQYESTEAFKAEHGPAASWSSETHDAWTDLLSRHAAAHVALGCARTATCRMTAGSNR